MLDKQNARHPQQGGQVSAQPCPTDVKKRVFKPDVKIIRPPNASARPRSRAHDKEKDHLSERSVMAHEELRQLNHKKLQFLLKQETRNSETVRRLVELVNSLCTFFRMLPRSLQFGVCKVMKLETFVRNEVVFTAGDLADKFYIVASGRVEICVNDISDLRSGKLHSAAVLQRGDSFGEVALMLDAPRSATVVVLSTRAELLAVTRDDFQTVLHDLYGISVQERLLFLRSLATFQSVPTFKLEAMAHMVQAVVHLAGTVFDILREGTVYFVVEGECRLRRASGALRKDHAAGKHSTEEETFYDFNTISRLGPGDFFGEMSVFPELKQEGWYAEAHTDCKLYTISGAELVNECARDIVDIMRSAGAFKREFYQSRLESMDEQRKSNLGGKPLHRKQAVAGKSAARQPKGSAQDASDPQSSGVAATPLKAIRKNREAIDEDEQELGVLEELKQHILESALELEKQRQELYHRETPTASNRQGKPGASEVLPQIVGSRPGSQSTRMNSFSGLSGITGMTGQPRRESGGTHVPGNSNRVLAEQNAYPRPSQPSIPPKQALMSAGGIQMLPAASRGPADTSKKGAANGSHERKPKQTVNPECSGFMHDGGKGYIGYDTKHMRANAFSRERMLCGASPRQ